ncbi:alpha/beta hydrolase [Streptomyces sp. NPDC058486]|uniref:alpha/beta hydrolase n=1 Tax=unclassified Streptomyces TaxID=2593676 RepID=UPI00365967BE
MKNDIRRGHALVLSLALLGGVAASGCGPLERDDKPRVAADPANRPELRSFYGQRLEWRKCGDVECTTLTVPMDYSKPQDGRTFTLPVARLAAKDQQRRIGSLVYNPGGPGGGGAGDLESGGAESFGTRARERFDIVSFDPRGVGNSVPAVDCTPARGTEPAEDEEVARPLNPDTAAERAQALEGSAAVTADCKKRSGPILPHVGTVDVARDMDVLRAALGDDKLTYFGFSYGTSLGTVYAEEFPRRVRAAVLDGAVDPSLDWSERAMSQAAGFRRAVKDYAENCAEFAGDSCPGTTPEEIRTLIDGLYKEAAAEPLPVKGSDEVVDARGVMDVVAMSMYAPEDQWKDLSEALADAGRGDGTKLSALASGESAEDDSSPEEETGTEETEAEGAEAEGAETEEASGSEEGAEAEEAPADNSDVAIIAVNCLDIPHPRTAQPYWDALAQAERHAGLYGTASVLDTLDCKDWPAGTGKPHRVNAKGVAPVLVVGTTGDPATPYAESESLARQFPGGMLLTYKGFGHLAYGRSNSCVTDAVDAYLVDLRPLRKGTVC